MSVEELAATLPDEGAILLSGPPMTGKYDLLIELIAAAEERSIVLSTKYGASRVVEDLHAAELDPDVPIGVVDAVVAPSDGAEPPNADHVEQVEGPENLTSLGVAYSELADRMAGDGPDGRLFVGIHSLAQLVLSNDLQSVYQFLQVVTGELRTAGWSGVAVVDEPLTTAEDPGVLEHHFDCVIEIDRQDTDRRYRVRNREELTAWSSF